MTLASSGRLALMLLLFSPALGDVYIMTRTYNLDPIPDLGADFGPDVPSEGLEGQLRVVEPEDACSPVTLKDYDTIWVALIARQQQFHTAMNCTFDIKVRHAQEAGAAAAIVYDDEYESLIIMSKPRGHPDPLIPSVFVTQKAGILMKKLLALEQEDGVRVRITPVSAVAWIGMVLSAVLGLLALTVVFSTFYILRSWSLWLSSGSPQPTGARAPGQPVLVVHNAQQRAADSGLPPHILRALPVLIYESAPPSRCRSLPSSMQHSHAAGCTLEAAMAADEAEANHAGLWMAAAATAAGMSPPASSGKQGSDLAHSGGNEEGLCGESGTEASSSNSSEYEEQTRPVGVHAGETKRTCTVCLERYMEGDKLRVLPCHHRFHMQCIDQWLSNRRLCPVCKHDASQALLPHPSRDTAGGGTAAASAPATSSGSSLVNTLAQMRRAWRARVSSGGAAQAAEPATGVHNRRAAVRARLMRWLPMMRPFQRQALLAALANELHEPLLISDAGTTHADASSQQQQAGQAQPSAIAHAADGGSRRDVDIEAGLVAPVHLAAAAAGAGAGLPAQAAEPPATMAALAGAASVPTPLVVQAVPVTHSSTLAGDTVSAGGNGSGTGGPGTAASAAAAAAAGGSAAGDRRRQNGVASSRMGQSV